MEGFNIIINWLILILQLLDRLLDGKYDKRAIGSNDTYWVENGIIRVSTYTIQVEGTYGDNSKFKINHP